jgi:hypothetical protein
MVKQVNDNFLNPNIVAGKRNRMPHNLSLLLPIIMDKYMKGHSIQLFKRDISFSKNRKS